MRELEKALREASYRELAETAPERGYEALRQELSATSAGTQTRKSSWFRWFMGTLLLFSVAALAAYVIDRQSDAPDPVETHVEPPSGPVAHIPQEAAIPIDGGREEVAKTLPPIPDITARAEADGGRENVTKTIPPTVDLTPRTERESPFLGRQVPRQSPAITHSLTPEIDVQIAQTSERVTSELPTTPTLPLSSLDSDERIVSPARPVAPLVPSSEQLDKVEQYLSPPEAFPGKGSIVVNDRRRKVATPLGTWDVTFSVYPLPLKQVGVFLPLSATPNQNRGQPFVVDGRTVELYSQLSSVSDYEYGRTLNPIAQLTVNRNTRSGFRYGLGMASLTQTDWGHRQIDKIAAANPENYYYRRRSVATYFLLSAKVGYTFRRRKRLRPWIALGVQTPVWYASDIEAHLLFEGEEYLQNSEKIRGGLLGNDPENRGGIFPSVEAGVQYSLSARWSVGLNVGLVPGELVTILPTPGLEARYHF